MKKWVIGCLVIILLSLGFSACDDTLGECEGCGGVWLTGTITGTNGACCGDDGQADIFYNTTHMCSYGGVIFDEDAHYIEDWYGDHYYYTSGKGVCELKGYTWFETTFPDNFINYSMSDILELSYNIPLVDLDKDGDLDAVGATMAYQGNIYVWENNGSVWGPWPVYDIGDAVDTITILVAGDLDLDGWVDFIAGDYSADAFYAYRNDGTPFNDAWSVNTVGDNSGNVALGTVLGDLDGDGDLDLVSGSSQHNDVFAWENDGSPFSGTWSRYDIGDASLTNMIDLADLDGDGDLDIIDSDQSGNVYIRRNDGTPFNDAWTRVLIGETCGTCGGSLPLAVGDLDLDGDLDIAVAAERGQVYVFENNGSVWGPWPQIEIGDNDPGTSGVYSLKVGDLDNDGDLDIITGSANSMLQVWENNGSVWGNWSHTLLGGSGNMKAGIGDLDLDGDLDILHFNYNGDAYTWQNLLINGSYGPCCGDDNTSDYFYNSSITCYFGALDQDDSQASCEYLGYNWFTGTITGSTGRCCGDDSVNDTFYNNTHMCSRGGLVFDADNYYTQDWYNDYTNYTSGKDVCVLKGYDWFPSESVFAAKVNNNIGTDSNPKGIAVGDFNNDGNLDALTANTGTFNNISYFEGYGNGSFKPGVFVVSTGTYPYQISVADFNKDGNLDFVTGDRDSNQMSYFEGRGDGAFDAGVTYAASGQPADIMSADFNNDGNLDVVTADFNVDKFSYFEGYGNGTFKQAVSFITGDKPTGITTGDFNNDGNVDVLTCNGNVNKFSYLEGNGDGTFKTKVDISAGGIVMRIINGDFNNDGNLDVIITGYSDDRFSYFQGNGDGTFQSRISYDTGLLTIGVEVGDFNNDGNLDVVTAEESTSQISVFNGYGNGSFIPVGTYSTSSAPEDVAVGDFDNDGDLDVVTADAGPDRMSYFQNLGFNGSNGGCCGDDYASDNFGNSSNCCEEGVVSFGACGASPAGCVSDHVDANENYELDAGDSCGLGTCSDYYAVDSNIDSVWDGYCYSGALNTSCISTNLPPFNTSFIVTVRGNLSEVGTEAPVIGETITITINGTDYQGVTDEWGGWEVEVTYWELNCATSNLATASFSKDDKTYETSKLFTAVK